MRRFRVFGKLLSCWTIVLFAVIFSDPARCVYKANVASSSSQASPKRIKIMLDGVGEIFEGWQAEVILMQIQVAARALVAVRNTSRTTLAATGVALIAFPLGIYACYRGISELSRAPESPYAGGTELPPDNSSTNISFINSSIFIPIAEANQIDKNLLLNLINSPANGEGHTDSKLGASKIICSSGMPSLIASELSPAYQESGSEQAEHHLFVLSKDSIDAERMELRGLTKADADSVLKFNTFLHNESKIDSIENVHDFSDFLTDQINDYSKMITDEHYKGCALLFIIRIDSAQIVFIPFS